MSFPRMIDDRRKSGKAIVDHRAEREVLTPPRQEDGFPVGRDEHPDGPLRPST